VVQLAGGDGVAERFTDDVHALYEAVLAKASVRFERLPAEFFRELARQLPDRTEFTFLYRGERVVAFAACLFSDEIFNQMFVGIDYSLNAEYDLYFNVFFEAVGGAFRRGARLIRIGQTADDCKHQRFTAYQLPLTVYAKGYDWITKTALSVAFPRFFPERPLRFPA
jgi:predicted N-acyltransferase